MRCCLDDSECGACQQHSVIQSTGSCSVSASVSSYNPFYMPCWLLMMQGLSVDALHSLKLPADSAGDCSGRPHWEKKLMQLFALARCIEDAQALSGYVSAGGTYAATAAASPEQREYQQRLEACRIVAGMHDADAVALHNLALKVIKAADMDRCDDHFLDRHADTALVGRVAVGVSAR